MGSRSLPLQLARHLLDREPGRHVRRADLVGRRGISVRDILYLSSSVISDSPNITSAHNTASVSIESGRGLSFVFLIPLIARVLKVIRANGLATIMTSLYPITV